MQSAELQRARSEGVATGLRLAATLLLDGELLREAAGVLVALADEEAEAWEDWPMALQTVSGSQDRSEL